jgi:hypothetical protein
VQKLEENEPKILRSYCYIKYNIQRVLVKNMQTVFQLLSMKRQGREDMESMMMQRTKRRKYKKKYL